VDFFTARGLSQRRACQIIGVSRSTLHYQPRPDHNADMSVRLLSIAGRHRRYGSRRAWALLHRQGQRPRDTRVHRLWKRLGLQAPRRARRRRKPPKEPRTLPTQAQYPGHVWTYDFVHDACMDGSKLKCLTVVDEFTRECLAIEVATSLPANKVIAVLKSLVAGQRVPQFLRSDNGPEFIAEALKVWLREQQTGTLYIDPGCPWQNGFAASFNGKFRDECLAANLFATVVEARALIEAYRREYNEARPHQSLGYLTPQEFKQQWLQEQSQTTED